MLLDEDSHLLGTATPLSREADDARPAPAKVQKYLTSLADAYGLPAEVIHAVAQTESGFDTGKVRTVVQPFRAGVFSEGDFASGNKAYGVMQLRDDQIGKTVRDADGSTFQIGVNVKTDWRANARAGVALLNQHYQLATLENPFGAEQERAQKAYSGYSGGAPFRDRYLQTLPYSDLPAHPEDRAFLQTLQDAPTAATQQTPSQSQAQGTSQSNAVSSGQSGSSPLPGPLQRLKENPGNLFFGDRGTSNPTPGATSPQLRFSDQNQRTPPKPSLLNLAPLFRSGPDTSPVSGSSALPRPLQRLEQNPGELFLHKPLGRETRPGEIEYDDSLRQGGSRNWRNNNPGNLAFSPWAAQHGAVGNDSAGFAIFPSLSQGEEAQRELLTSRNYSGLPLEQAIRRWTTNDPKAVQDAYIISVVQRTGIGRNTILANLSPDQLSKIQDAMKIQEGWREGTVVQKRKFTPFNLMP